MSRRAGPGVVLLVVLSVVSSSSAAAPPAILGHSRYVALGYDLGDGFVSETDVRASAEAFPEEREALRRIRASLEAQGRFVVVVRPAEAELLVAVRKGRLVAVGGGVPIGGPPAARPGGGPVGIGSQGGVQVSSPDDMIEVFDARAGTLVWRGMRPGGLSGAGPPLLDSFLAEVAKAERATKP